MWNIGRACAAFACASQPGSLLPHVRKNCQTAGCLPVCELNWLIGRLPVTPFQTFPPGGR
jgi:hypothetical protein